MLLIVQNAPLAVDVRVRSEAETLAAAGMDVTIIAPAFDASDKEQAVSGVAVATFRGARNRGGVLGYLWEYAVSLFRIRKVVRSLRNAYGAFHVVHVGNPPDFLALAAVSLRRDGTKFVFDHHDLSPELYEARGGRVLTPVLRAFERLGFWTSDVVISTNETYRELAIQRGHAAPDAVFVVRNAPSERFRLAAQRAARLHADDTNRDIRVLWAGTMGVQDGVDIALDALTALLELRPTGWDALFVGDGEYLDEARQTVGAGPLDGRVHFRGRVAHDDVAALIGSADVCLATEPRNALNEASTMIKVAEYMAAGRAVVATDLRETRKTIGDAGVLVGDEPSAIASALSTLIGSGERRRILGARASERAVLHLMWESSAKELLKAYARLL